jgi:hypothetical protein
MISWTLRMRRTGGGTYVLPHSRMGGERIRAVDLFARAGCQWQRPRDYSRSRNSSAEWNSRISKGGAICCAGPIKLSGAKGRMDAPLRARGCSDGEKDLLLNARLQAASKARSASPTSDASHSQVPRNGPAGSICGTRAMKWSGPGRNRHVQGSNSCSQLGCQQYPGRVGRPSA